MRPGSPFGLSARRRVTLVALTMLPALLPRALLPVGFMPEIDGAGIHLGFCPGEAQPPGAPGSVAGASGHAGHHLHHHEADHGSPSPARHPPCLFALSASPAFAPEVPAVAPLPPAATALTAESPSRVSVPAIVRAQSPRGPPLPA